MKWLVIGAGMTGATFARIRAEAGDHVTVLDQRRHIAGNCFDEQYGEHGLIHKYGPHLFHTNSGDIYNFLGRFTEWRPYEHEVLVEVYGKRVPLPVNFNTIEALFSQDMAGRIITRLERLTAQYHLQSKQISLAFLKKMAEEHYDDDLLLHRLYTVIFSQIFKPYTEKQWGKPIESVDPKVLARVPIRLNRDNRYFTDTYQALPSEGYTKMFGNMLDHPNIQVHTERGVSLEYVRECQTRGVRVFFTGQLDAMFDYRYGRLPYRSLKFEHYVLRPLEAGTVNLPTVHDFTRMTDQSIINNHGDDKTLHVVTYETPGAFNPHSLDFNTPYYPVNSEESDLLHAMYAQEAKELGILTGGRLGSFQYLNMDQACGQALKLARTVE